MRTAFAAPKVALVGFIVMQAGCATIVHGKTQVVPITSSPTGASVSIDSVAVGRTPIDATLARGRPHVVSVVLDSVASFEIKVERTISPWVFGNMFTYVLPVFLDLSNGAAYNVSPDFLHVVFPTFGAATLGARPGRAVTSGDRVRMLTTASPDSFVYATIDSTLAGHLVVRRSLNAVTPPGTTQEVVLTADVHRLDISHGPRHGENGQLAMRAASLVALGAGAAITKDLIGTLFYGALINIGAIPISFAIGYAAVVPRWSPREAHRTGSPLLVGDRVRVWQTDSPNRRISGRLVDLEATDMLIVTSKDTLHVARASIATVERLGGLSFKKGALLAIGVGAALGMWDVANRKFPTQEGDRALAMFGGAIMAVYSFPAFAPRRWVSVLKW